MALSAVMITWHLPLRLLCVSSVTVVCSHTPSVFPASSPGSLAADALGWDVLSFSVLLHFICCHFAQASAQVFVRGVVCSSLGTFSLGFHVGTVLPWEGLLPGPVCVRLKLFFP